MPPSRLAARQDHLPNDSFDKFHYPCPVKVRLTEINLFGVYVAPAVRAQYRQASQSVAGAG
jgi:hypothetical protein